jgi:hypothetical protein
MELEYVHLQRPRVEDCETRSANKGTIRFVYELYLDMKGYLVTEVNCQDLVGRMRERIRISTQRSNARGDKLDGRGDLPGIANDRSGLSENCQGQRFSCQKVVGDGVGTSAVIEVGP